MTAASMGDVLHEREAELAQLGRAVERAVGGHGAVVLVEGSAGIGKTRLLDEACRMADGRARVLRARGGEQERDIPLLVTRELFTPYVASAPAEELDQVFAGAAALAGPLLGRGTAHAGTADARFALVHGLYWLVANLADVEPLVLAVDDAHWVDDSTQRWLAYLLPRVEELSVLLVVATRPRELSPSSPLGVALAATHDVVRIRPAALTVRGAQQLLGDLLPGADDEFCAAARRSSGGNPLLLRALASAVRERGISPSAATAPLIDQLGAVELGRIVLPRLHQLGSAAVALARAVAILGDGADLADAADLAGVRRPEAAAALDGLVEAEILVATPGLGFTHPLVRAAVHDDIAPGTRAALHLAAARLLHGRRAEPESVARHLSAAGRVGEDWVAPALEAAARVAAARGAPEAAIAHLEAALREDLSPADRFRLLLKAGWQGFRAWDRRAPGWLHEALRLAPDDASAVRAWAASWNWHMIARDDYDPAALVDGLPATLGPPLSYTVQTHFLLDFGFSGCDTLSLLRRYPVPDDGAVGSSRTEQLWLSARAADASIRGRSAAQALAFADRVDVQSLLTSRASDTPNLAWLVLARAGAGDIAGAEALARSTAEQNRRNGSRMPLEWMTLCGAMAEIFRGDLTSAAALLAPYLEGESIAEVPVAAPMLCAFLVWVHVERDDLDRVPGVLATYGYLGADPPPTWQGAFLHHHRARARRAAGDVAGAVADLERCRDVLAGFDALDNPSTPWRAGLAGCLVDLGRRDEARDLATEQVVRARAFGAAPLLGLSLRSLAAAVGGDEGLALTEQAVDVLADSEARGEHARALLVHGRLLRLGRQSTRARDLCARALDLADHLGALRLARQVEEELRLTGARPRRRAVTGVHALTPAELRVASLAAEGMSNPEIGQSLFVTRKTVEKHLGAVFAKLHFSSRDQLPAVLER